jgi:hypothetical protein
LRGAFVPQGLLKIARRFNAGFATMNARVLEGRMNPNSES